MNKLSRHGFCGNIDLSAKQREVQLRVESLHQERDNEEKLDFFEKFCQEMGKRSVVLLSVGNIGTFQ